MRRSRSTVGAVLCAVALAVGCADEVEEPKTADSVASDAPHRSAMEELQAIPADLRAEVDKLTKPIDDVDAVVDQLTGLPKKYDINASALAAAVQGVLRGETVKMKLGASLGDDATRELTAAMTKLKGAVAALKETPERVGLLMKKIGVMAGRVPILAAKVGADSATTIANPFADAAAKAKAQADVQNAKQVGQDVVKVVTDTQAKLVAIPKKASGALAKLTAAFAGGDGAPASGDDAERRVADAPPKATSRSGKALRKVIVRMAAGLDNDAPNLRANVDAVLVQRGFVTVPDGVVDEALRGRRGSEAQRLEDARAALEADAVIAIAKGTSLGAGQKTVTVAAFTSGAGSKVSPRLVQGRPQELESKVPAAVGELLDRPDVGARRAASPSPAGREAVETAPAPSPAAPAAAAAPSVAAPSVSSGADQVILKDGTAVRGRVTKHEPGSYVTIETADGAQRTLAWDRVGEVVVGPPKRPR